MARADLDLCAPLPQSYNCLVATSARGSSRQQLKFRRARKMWLKGRLVIESVHFHSCVVKNAKLVFITQRKRVCNPLERIV